MIDQQQSFLNDFYVLRWARGRRRISNYVVCFLTSFQHIYHGLIILRIIRRKRSGCCVDFTLLNGSPYLINVAQYLLYK